MRSVVAASVVVTVMVAAAGCIDQPALLSLDRQRPIDRGSVEYPSEFELTPLVRGLDSPTAMCFDKDRGDLVVAESGIDGSEPHIFGYHLATGAYFNIYPFRRTISFFPTGFVIYGPVGGMVVYDHRIYVSHRDRDGRGVITAFGYDGSHTTIVANLPAQGDYGVTDLAVHKRRLYFGIGTATNSGVVGLDNYDAGWAKAHPDVSDQLFSWSGQPIKLNGARFDVPNPRAGLGEPDLLVTTPFEPLGHSNQSLIYPAAVPNGGVCSVALPDGDRPQVEATGLHNPRGLATDQYDHLYATNDGMQPRGTRPVINDPDAMVYVAAGADYGWPDRTTDGRSVTDPAFAPPISFLIKSGYSELTPLIDPAGSGIPPFSMPDFNTRLVARFPSLSGAAKMAFVPQAGPFARFGGGTVVALDGDRAPYASGGLKLNGFVGGKVVLVDVDGKVSDFLYNVAGTPASRQPFGAVGLERPCDVKFSPIDGTLYILDFGQMENDSAKPRYHSGTGAIYKLAPVKKGPGPGS